MNTLLQKIIDEAKLLRLSVSGRAMLDLENSCTQLEKEYASLEQTRDKNKQLSITRQSIHKGLQEKLQQKEDELSKAYSKMAIEEERQLKDSLIQIEKEIAGGFAHKIRNIFTPVLLLKDQIERENSLDSSKKNLGDWVSHLLACPKGSDWNEILDHFEIVNKNHLTLLEMIKITKNSLDKNFRLINDLMNLSYFQRGKDVIDINKLIASVTEQAFLGQVGKQIKLILQFEGNSGITGDPQHFRILIRNFVTNAIQAIMSRHKLSHRGKLTIKTSSKNSMVILSVMDNGKGIPLNKINKIMQPFYTDKPNGHGIGLSYVKK